MNNAIKALAILGYLLLTISARADGPALKCDAPVGGVSQCTVVATGDRVQCSVVDGLTICL